MRNPFVTIATSALIGLWLVLCSTAGAEAKQCVWNNGGFVMRVDWFNPGVVTSRVNPTDHYQEFSFSDQPMQTDVLWAPSGACIDRGPTVYQALLSICGALKYTRVIAYPPNWPAASRIDCSIWKLETPSTERYLDVWGTTGVPASGPGGAS
jgi:hypothetical protein